MQSGEPFALAGIWEQLAAPRYRGVGADVRSDYLPCQRDDGRDTRPYTSDHSARELPPLAEHTRPQSTQPVDAIPCCTDDDVADLDAREQATE